MPKCMLRFRFEGMAVIEFNPDTINGFKVDYDEDNKCHYLSAFNDAQEFILESGTSNTCRAMLNKIHSILDTHVRDINS